MLRRSHGEHVADSLDRRLGEIVAGLVLALDPQMDVQRDGFAQGTSGEVLGATDT